MAKLIERLTRFSIVIPTYNSAATLEETLASVRSQQWSDLEVLVVDGLSSDKTIELAKAFEGLEVKVICERDKGIYDAINKGIAQASGDLICIIGSDDRLAEGALRVVHEAWVNSRADIVAGKAFLESPDGTVTIRLDETYGVGALVSGIPFCHNSMYVTPEAYKRVGQYNLKYKICADAEWVHRSIRAGCVCKRVGAALVHFSLAGTSSTNDELIMAETYSVVASNFSGVSVEDAEVLFKAVRRWTDGSQVSAVLDRHSTNHELGEALRAGLGREDEGMRPAAEPLVKNNHSLKVRALRKIKRIFRSRLLKN